MISWFSWLGELRAPPPPPPPPHTTTNTVERGGDCNDLAVTAYPGAPERCDGLDNDCGGVVDELYPCVRGSAVTCATACGSQGMGTCSATCMQPSFAACAAPAESCNAHDDDCDGRVDETWLSFGPGRTLTAAVVLACSVMR